MNPQPMSKLDVSADGRDERTCGRPAPHRGVLEPDAVKVARPVLRRAQR
jgi:hypothetical protein